MPEVRSGTAGDVPAAASFWSSVSADGRTPGHLAEHYLEPAGALFAVALAGPELIGLAVGTPARAGGASGEKVPGAFHVNTLFIQPAHRLQGLGEALLARLMAEARAAGYTRFQLWVHTENRGARRLYEKSGFTGEGPPLDGDGAESLIRYVCQG